MKVLVTGGAGYIGSHTCLELLRQDHEIVVVDNLSNSKIEGLKRVEKLSGKTIPFEEVDLLDAKKLDTVFTKNKFDAVIHFAGLKAVGESTKIPLTYYENNITGTLHLLESMKKHSVSSIIFSSSATVYGDPQEIPLKENTPLGLPPSPYGKTKLFIEYILKDLFHSDSSWHISILRYFNPVGADKSGEIGEDPNGIPNNLFPFIAQVAVGRREKLSVFGNDYPTKDGTCIRDYIHVTDLALGHIKALEKLTKEPTLDIYNLGTGKGSTILEVIQAFEKASGKKIPYEFVERRDGDVAENYADPRKAEEELDWKASKTLDDMCIDTWNFQSKNPNGY